MVQILLQFFASLPEELVVLILAALPVTELRAALPFALTVAHLSPASSLLWSFLGNILPIPFIFLFLEFFVERSRRLFPRCNRFWDWVFERTRKKFLKTHALWGDIALVLFVMIPFPGTGAWTGTLAAWLFGIPFRTTIGLVSLGVFFVGLIVLGLSLGIISIF